MSAIVARLALLALSLVVSPASFAFVVQPGEVLAVRFTVASVPDSPILQDYPYDTIAFVIGGSDVPGVTATIYDGTMPQGTAPLFMGSAFYWRTPSSLFSDDAGGALSSVPSGVLASFPFVQGFTGIIEAQSPVGSAFTFDESALRVRLGRGLPGGALATEGGTLVTVDSFSVHVIPEPATWALVLGGLLALAIVRPRRVRRVKAQFQRPAIRTLGLG